MAVAPSTSSNAVASALSPPTSSFLGGVGSTTASYGNNVMADINSVQTPAVKSVMQGINPDLGGATCGPVFDAVASAKNSSATATSERLYIVESRAAQGLYNNNYISDRGPIASIKLLNSNNVMVGANTSQVRRTAYLPVGNQVSDTSLKSLLDTSAKGGYNQFLLSSCDVAYSEKTQILTTFGDNEVIYFFGKNPVVMNLSGVLIDSLQNDWFGQFINLYNTFLRGTQLAKNFEMLQLVLPNMVVTGSILSLSHQQVSNTDTNIPFSFQFYAKSITMTPQPHLSGPATNQSVKAIFKNPTRTSKGASLPSGNHPLSLGGGFAMPTLNLPGGGMMTGYGMFRSAIISPAVSVIASIAKIIQIVTSSLSKITSSFSAPMNAVLSDVLSVAAIAVAVSALVMAAPMIVGSLLSQINRDISFAISALKNMAGVICSLPESLAQSFQGNFRAGLIPGTAAVLSSGPRNNVSKSAVLSSGAPRTVQNSFVI